MNTPRHQIGNLGPKPQQAHVVVAQFSYAPTDIQATMNRVSLSPIDDQ
jgi:hypothetical protein